MSKGDVSGRPDRLEAVPFVTAQQMGEVDRLMVEEYGILLVQMMENAGRHLAHLARERFLGGDPKGCKVLVLAGSGGNGGGGLTCARWLHNWNAQVEVWLAVGPSEMAEVPRHQLTILGRTGIPFHTPIAETALPAADLVIDALLGYSLRGAPHGSVAQLIRGANAHPAAVLSLDLPSGVEATTGAVQSPAIQASATLTLALPKEGLRAPQARSFVGELYLGDIGVPPELYGSPTLGIQVGPLFAVNEILRLW